MIDGGIIMIICVPIVAAFMGCYLYGSRIKHHREIEKDRIRSNYRRLRNR